MTNLFEQSQDAEAQQKSDWQSISSGLTGALDTFALQAKRRQQLFFALFVVVLVNIIDQVTKQLARTHLIPFNETSYLDGWIRLRHSENAGAFLSLGAQFDANVRLAIFTVLVTLFLIWATWMLLKKAGRVNFWFVFGWALLIAGGIGNVIDRAYKHSVTDFLIAGKGAFQTGVFNIADMAIMAGIVVVIFLGRE